MDPSLGSARILSKKLGSARAIFQKARIEKIVKNEPIWYYYLGKERFGFYFSLNLNFRVIKAFSTLLYVLASVCLV